MTITETQNKTLEDLIQSVETLSTEFDGEMLDPFAEVDLSHLSVADVEDLYRMVLVILQKAIDGKQPSDQVAQKIARTAATRAAAALQIVSTESATETSGGLTFHKRFGLAPRPVLPVPTFNGRPVMLREGYVDVLELPLWIGNHRVELFVEQFRGINHRDPDDTELLELMHGKLAMPGVDKDDPFKLRPLAESIARKGVERAPIVTWDGEPKDGNRRIAASRLVLADPKMSPEQKDRARWIRVWQAPENTTPDEFDAIVVALNFEPDHKEDWPEYVKARLVVDSYRELAEQVEGSLSQNKGLALRKEVAEKYAIKHNEVKRYLEMVRWAEDFEDYHVVDRGLDEASVRYKANDIFQWFYEVQAGRGANKLINKLDQDDDLRGVVYDLMFDTLDSGAQVRNLHKVVADDDALDELKRAHAEIDKDEALKLVASAIAEAAKNAPTKRAGFGQFMVKVADKLGQTPTDQWKSVSITVLKDLRRVFPPAMAAVDSELESRGAAQDQ